VLAVFAVDQLISKEEQPAPVTRVATLLTGGLVLGLSYTFWTQAIIIEVYSLLILFFAFALLLALRWQMITPSRAGAFLFGHILGIAVTHHLSALLWLPAFAFFVLPIGIKRLALVALGGITGLWGWVWLYFRRGEIVYANWTGLQTGGIQELYYHIVGRMYRGLARPLNLENVLEGFKIWSFNVPNEITWVGIVLSLVGWALLARHNWRFAVAILLWLLPLAAITGIYTAENTQTVYPLPLILLASLLIAWSVYQLANRQQVVGIILIMVLLGWMGWTHYQRLQQAEPLSLGTFVENAEAILPQDAIVFVQQDRDTFALWYYNYVEGWRPDLTIVNMSMLKYSWYRDAVAALNPEWIFSSNSIDGVLSAIYATGRPVASGNFLMGVNGRQVEQIDAWYIMQ
jgi:hypothetical protein